VSLVALRSLGLLASAHADVKVVRIHGAVCDRRRCKRRGRSAKKTLE
jgi:hypothetical protein